jgi:hypothetical protein
MVRSAQETSSEIYMKAKSVAEFRPAGMKKHERITHLPHPSKTSLYTMFLVLFPDLSTSLFGLAKISVVFLDTPLDNATYSWPCENTGSGR